MKTIIILEPKMKANLIRILQEDIHQHEYAREKIDTRLMGEVPEQEEELLVNMYELHGQRMNEAKQLLEVMQSQTFIRKPYTKNEYILAEVGVAS